MCYECLSLFLLIGLLTDCGSPFYALPDQTPHLSAGLPVRAASQGFFLAILVLIKATQW